MFSFIQFGFLSSTSSTNLFELSQFIGYWQSISRTRGLSIDSIQSSNKSIYFDILFEIFGQRHSATIEIISYANLANASMSIRCRFRSYSIANIRSFRWENPPFIRTYLYLLLFNSNSSFIDSSSFIFSTSIFNEILARKYSSNMFSLQSNLFTMWLSFINKFLSNIRLSSIVIHSTSDRSWCRFSPTKISFQYLSNKHKSRTSMSSFDYALSIQINYHLKQTSMGKLSKRSSRSISLRYANAIESRCYPTE